MTLFFIVTDITTRGGVERTTSVLANTFIERGIEVTIVSLFKRMACPAFPLDERVKIIYATDKDYNLKRSRWALLPMLFVAYRRLFYILRSLRFDLLIVQCFLPALLVWMSGKSRKAVVCDHFKYALYKEPVLSIRNFIYRRFRYIVTLTQADASRYKEVAGFVRCIPNISPYPISDCADLSAKRLIAVGRLQQEKGFDLLLKAVKELFVEFPDWHLDIYGEGPEYNALQQQRDLYHLQSFVSLRGYTEKPREEMLRSSIYVMSSRHEGLPMVLLEAMSCALPIVSFQCSEGPAELLHDHIGYLVEPENPDALRLALREMMASESMRKTYAERGQEAVRVFSPDIVFQKWKILFDRIGCRM